MNSQILPIHMIYSCVLNEIKYSLGSSVFSFVIAGYSQICRTGNGGSLCDLSVAGPRKCCLGPESWGHRSPLLPLPDRLLFSPVSLLQTLHAQPAPPHSLLLSCCGDLSPSGQRKGGKRGGRQPFSHSILLWLPTELCHLFLDSCKSLLRPLEHLLWQAVLPSSLHPAETEVRPCRCPVKELCGAFSLSSECSPNPLTLLGTVSRSQNW